MVLTDFHQREVTVKLVYYGPPLSGKTTNLAALHARLDPSLRGRLLSLDTAQDRTLYFDLLPVIVRAASGMTIKVKLYTVPGQVIHDSTRRLVLNGVDGVVFVADARRAQAEASNVAWANLKANLRQNGLDPRAVPTVIQLNKQDLPPEELRTADEVQEIRRRGPEPVYLASALRGDGVAETLLGLVRMVWDALDQRLQLSAHTSVTRDELVAALAMQLRVPPARTTRTA